MKTEFKLGDKVQAIASPHEGIAEVVVIDENDDPPTIGIQYPGNNEIYYFKGELLGFLKKVEETVAKPKVQLKAGDIVRFGGVEYELKPSIIHLDYPFKIAISSQFHYLFTMDGRISTDHTEPVLTLVRRVETEKKWVKKRHYGAIFKYEDNFRCLGLFETKVDISGFSNPQFFYGWEPVEIEVLE